MSEDADPQELAPLDALIEILPKIEKAKERARLGTALQKATAAAEQYASVPERLNGLSKLLGAIALDKEDLRAELSLTLNTIAKMGRVLGGEPTIEQLDGINQAGMAQLPLHIDKVATRVEEVWRRDVQQNLGGQAALGEVLSAIPGVEALGSDLSKLATRTRALEDAKTPAEQRIVERDALLVEASALANRLLEAGIAPPIAEFLVAVAANPVRLSDLSEEIFAWIREHDALALFSVSASGA